MPPKNNIQERTLKDFYQTFLTNKISKSKLKESTVHNLYEIPKRDKGKQMPHYTADPKAVYQADVLYLPEDTKTKDKYALVVVDIQTKLFDAEPMKDRKAEDVVKAFKKIFRRRILSKPSTLMQVDPGVEFNNTVTKEYFDSLGIGYRFGKVGRSRQQAVVEAKNKIIAKALFMRMTANELQTGEKDTDWVEFLPALVKELNKIIKAQGVPKQSTEPILTDKTILLEVGQNVRVILDKPEDVTIGKLMGHFRATDIRWSPKVTKITNVILTPGQPPMYQVEGDDKRAYTYNQLQTVDNNEEKPFQFSGSKYIVEKIVDKKGKKYLVKWKGYGNDSNSWEDGTQLSSSPDIKKMIDSFNKLNQEQKKRAPKKQK